MLFCGAHGSIPMRALLGKQLWRGLRKKKKKKIAAVCVWRLACAYAAVGMCNQPGSSGRLVFLRFLISVLTHAACLRTFLLTLLHDVWLPAQRQKI